MNAHRRALTALAVLAIGWGACEHANVAEAAKPPVIGPAPSGVFCGGQGATLHPVPWDCDTKVKLINGTGFWAHVHADGIQVTVTIHLLAPRAVDTPCRIVHHEGNSGAGLALDQAQGTVPAGALTLVLVDSVPGRVGQLDIKCVFTGNGEEQGSIGGPGISNGPPIDTQTVPTTAPATTVPAPSAPSPSVPGVPPVTVTAVSSKGTLPATGSSEPYGLLAFIALMVIAFGVLLCRRFNRVNSDV
jgi:LPXTG-motif cell wall-anchored protein